MGNDNTLVISREFNASPERVYEAWTNPQIMQRWWGPEGFNIPELSLDVREGGDWSTTFQSEQIGTRIVSGKYVKLEPPRLLVFTWAWSTEGERGHETVVEVLLESGGAGTIMTLTQKTFPEKENRDANNRGWLSSFNKLDRELQ